MSKGQSTLFYGGLYNSAKNIPISSPISSTYQFFFFLFYSFISTKTIVNSKQREKEETYSSTKKGNIINNCPVKNGNYYWGKKNKEKKGRAVPDFRTLPYLFSSSFSLYYYCCPFRAFNVDYCSARSHNPSSTFQSIFVPGKLALSFFLLPLRY